jgi:hypothetical protein
MLRAQRSSKLGEEKSNKQIQAWTTFSPGHMVLR